MSRVARLLRGGASNQVGAWGMINSIKLIL